MDGHTPCQTVGRPIKPKAQAYHLIPQHRMVWSWRGQWQGRNWQRRQRQRWQHLNQPQQPRGSGCTGAGRGQGRGAGAPRLGDCSQPWTGPPWPAGSRGAGKDRGWNRAGESSALLGFPRATQAGSLWQARASNKTSRTPAQGSKQTGWRRGGGLIYQVGLDSPHAIPVVDQVLRNPSALRRKAHECDLQAGCGSGGATDNVTTRCVH